MTIALEVAQKGQVTIPKALRDQYKIEAGQQMTLVDLGGSFLLTPRISQVHTAADRLRDGLLESGATLEEMLAELRRKRESEDAR
jgi:bifunctional DNA-binding transcriptional regulator/antitoxin component of YhaV-PrlF toxin-antitoxin module